MPTWNYGWLKILKNIKGYKESRNQGNCFLIPADNNTLHFSFFFSLLRYMTAKFGLCL
jgi:hypothetical protein